MFLVTHSPFIIDVRNLDDLSSVISFSADYSIPVSIADAPSNSRARLSSLVPRLNVHHKQLFFCDNPIFVEGILDAQMIEAIQERRNVSVTAAGSCIIDVGGCEEVTKYIELCRLLRKSAFFFYDLDSLFLGSLRQCIKSDNEIVAFLAALGLGTDFASYCGKLDSSLTEAVKLVCESDSSSEEIIELKNYLNTLELDRAHSGKNLVKARVAVLVDLMSRRDSLAAVISGTLAADIEGRLNKIVELLRAKNVLLLKGGAMEHYLPSYGGNRYNLDESAKRKAVEAETAELGKGLFDRCFAERYGALFESIIRLPSKATVDTDLVLKRYLCDYIYQLQGLISTNNHWDITQLNEHFATAGAGLGKLFRVEFLQRVAATEFSARILIVDDRRVVEINQDTNAGMRKIQLPSKSAEPQTL